MHLCSYDLRKKKKLDLSFLLNAMPCWTSHMCGSWPNKASARQCWSLGMTTWMFVLSFTWERHWWGVDGSTCSNICLTSGGSKCLNSNDADYYSRELLGNWILNTMGPLRLTDKMAYGVSLWENNVKRQIANVASSLFRIALCHCFAPTLVVNPVPKVVGSEMQHMPLQQKTPPQTCGIRQAQPCWKTLRCWVPLWKSCCSDRLLLVCSCRVKHLPQTCRTTLNLLTTGNALGFSPHCCACVRVCLNAFALRHISRWVSYNKRGMRWHLHTRTSVSLNRETCKNKSSPLAKDQFYKEIIDGGVWTLTPLDTQIYIS